jgi:uncharacterized membrane protein YvlD (DUF360 family)
MNRRNGEIHSSAEAPSEPVTRSSTQSRPGFMKRHRRTAGFLRLIVIWLINTFALYLLVRIMPGVHTGGYLCDGDPCQGGLPLSTALAIAVMNALLWPLFVRLLLPLGVVTLGLAPLLLNGVIVYVAARWQGEFAVDTVFHAVLLAFGVTVINTLVTTVLGLDDIDFYYRRGMRKRARRIRGKNAKKTDVPGVVFLEVDGLAYDVLRRAMRDGNAATASRWHRNGHRLMSWECDWSSQTSGCQAGLLHGNNHDIPAFRWWDKERGAAMVSNHPVDAMALERRLSDGKGLLAFGGASRSNLLSGEAPHTLLTLSTVLKKRGKTGEDYYAYFANPPQRHPDPDAGHRRHRNRALDLHSAAPARHVAADPPDARLRLRARLHHGGTARPPGGSGGLRHPGWPAGGVHHLPGLRRGGPSFRAGADVSDLGAARHRSSVRQD